MRGEAVDRWLNRCYSKSGIHIPGCMGCAVYGHRACTCPPADWLANMYRRLHDDLG